MSDLSSHSESYRDGFRLGLATGALALSVVTFINLFWFEKSLVAVARCGWHS